MKPTATELRIDPKHLEIVNALGRHELDEMADALLSRRLELMAQDLTARGVIARHVSKFADPTKCPIYWSYILVYAPDGATTRENAWATLDECRRLLDTLANLPPARAYDRWFPKVEPEDNTYTEADAQRDMRQERLQLRSQYAAGEIDGETFRVAYRATRDYADLAR